MKDLSYLDTPIEMLAVSPRLDMLHGRLRALGFRPFRARPDAISECADPLIIDAASATIDLMRLRRRQRDRTIVILGAHPDAEAISALTIEGDAALAALPSRLAAEHRRRLVASEARLRILTSSAFTAAPLQSPTVDEPAILYLGQGSSAFLSLSRAISAAGCTCVSALTDSMARRYLAQRRFDGVIVNVPRTAELASPWLKLAAADPRLSDVPLFLHLAADADPAYASTLAGGAVVLRAGASESELAREIVIAVDARLRETPYQPSREGSAEIVDRVTGLFNRMFFEAHLAAQSGAADAGEWPLTLVAIRLDERGGAIDKIKALAEIAGLFPNALRGCDAPARIDSSTLCVSMPGAPYAGGASLAGRLRAALEADPATAALVEQLSWRVVERRRYHTVDTLLKSTQIGPFAAFKLAA